MNVTRKKDRTTYQEIRQSFIILFIFFALFTGAAVVTVVGVHLVHQSESQSIQLLRSLNRSFIDDKPDWNQWRKSSNINTENTYVRVTDQSGANRQSDVFYSKGAHTFLSSNPTPISKSLHLPFFPALTYSKHYGLFYYRSGERRGEHKKIKSEIWLSLNSIIKTLASVILVVLGTLFVGLILGWFVISLIAKRLTRSLQMLQRTAQSHSQSVVNVESLLPVPNSPVEVRELATSFNDLLSAIIENNKREKAFISNASHELRTPIAAIRGHISLVKRRGKDHPEIIDTSLHFIDDESAKMQALVNSLLALSRADKEVVQKTTFDLVAIVNETVEEQRVLLEQNIEVRGAKTASVNANQTNVLQILSTLFDNAGKYAGDDSTITVQITNTAHDTILSVENNGPSIPDEDKKHIFDRFYRGDHAHNSQITGNGLGLAIAAQLATLNGIQIKVADVVPHGVRFELVFKKIA
ncbi:HAMP domain-containing histidine kinase [Lentilactobacillus parabuchneri]|jgi:signal transduction histidine kinase|uniref:histidine kinase n=2 Tax=Lentilactobacillus parabuchneri TaxID=152331 RepID=A0A0R1YXP3_9LACO|nr:ATPase histidine kinase DNA gyrase B HSP90 domain protein [Lentilactobacillus parabuchneri DSM 5707 = NBRC 107865]KRN70819.1 ATPase histidine kinase DNA gyrase B HSP90 domain protein [Lentilactobacillus parabuchneri]MCT2884176.1 sensor histidine kinase [Lentilactobacillus parabuchneri]OBU97339.1 two-component sensor histidine kinase [Lentilactobacillus parabuchneri]OCB80998.1 two-component sensor histidine kinase [Lentilactobacillus parabuchneri]